MKVTFLPHQAKTMESAKGEVIQSGAFGSGKSRSLCYKAVYLSVKYPHNRGFICRKVLQSLKATTLKTLLDGDGTSPPALPRSWIKSHNKTERLITLVNESEIYYGNMDRDFVKSMNLGWAAVDELSEISEEDWNFLGGRLRLAGIPVTQLIGATNPASKQHWIWNRVHNNPPKDKDGNTNIEFIQSSTLDNFYLPAEYIQKLRSTLFGFYYQRYVLGMWVGNDDIVYDNFNPEKHSIKDFVIPKSWKRYRSFDFGYRSPFVCGWFAVAGDDAREYGLNPGDIILYRQMYYTQRTAGVNAERVNFFSKYLDGNPEKYINSVADWNTGDRAELESKGIFTRPANKDITLGIQKVRERLGNSDPTKGSIVEPRFFIFKNSLVDEDPKIRLDLESGNNNNDPMRAEEEFTAYGWKPNKEEPSDEYNHAMDMIRYMIMEIDGNHTWADVPFVSVKF